MIIRKDEIEISHLENFKGGEKHLDARMYFDGTNRILTRARLVPGASIGLHTHDDSCEVIFITKGQGTTIEQAPGEERFSREVSQGDCLYCPKGHSHCLKNASEAEDLEFLAVVPQQ